MSASQRFLGAHHRSVPLSRLGGNRSNSNSSLFIPARHLTTTNEQVVRVNNSLQHTIQGIDLPISSLSTLELTAKGNLNIMHRKRNIHRLDTFANLQHLFAQETALALSRLSKVLKQRVQGDVHKNHPPTRQSQPPPVISTHEAPHNRKYNMATLLRDFDPKSPPLIHQPGMGHDQESLLQLQLWLECESQRESVSRIEAALDSAKNRKDFVSLPLIQQHLLQWYNPLKKRIEESQKSYLAGGTIKGKDFKRFGPFLCTIQPEKLAIITIHEAVYLALKKGGIGSTLTLMSHRIGDAVEAEVNVQRALKNHVLKESQTSSSSTSSSSSSSSDEWMYSGCHLDKFMNEIKKDSNKNSRVLMRLANKRARKIMESDDEWTSADKVKLGSALIQMLLQSTRVFRDKWSIPVHIDEETYEQSGEPAFTYEKRWVDGKKIYGFIVMNEWLSRACLEDKFDSMEGFTSRYQPMIVPPRPWTGPRDGAYFALNVDLMRTHGCQGQRDALHEADLTTVLDGLNVLGRVPWKINKKILAVAQRCWDEGIAIGDIPSRTDFKLPPEPIPIKYDETVYKDKESATYKLAREEYRAYCEAKVRYKRTYQKNMDLRSLRCSALLKLNQAEKFKNFDQIYFPYNLDFRGRSYPVPPHFSNIGSDLCRGMLLFSQPKPLGARGLFWLKVHLSNLAGNNKMSFEDRARFTDDNMQNIRDCVNDPFGENRWWMKLEDPFQGLATCYEIVNAIDSGDPAKYECHLAVHMDGSCNGLQHYAALGRDKAGGKAVNLCNYDKPQDVYIGVMAEVIRRVADDAAKDLTFDVSDMSKLSKAEKELLKSNRAAKLVNGLIDRSVVKRTVMTSVYGVTYIGARKQIMEKIEEKLEGQGHEVDEIENEVHAACGYLAKVTMEVIGELFTGAKLTMGWLSTCARLIASQGQPVSWMSAVGVPAVQPYRQKKPYTVVTLLQSVILMANSDNLPIHKTRQVSAFPPNYVHSLDSSHMLLTALEMDKRALTFSAVHDSFWTHACDVDEMNQVLRECFVELYSRPLLEELKKTWELQYPSIQFPDVPTKGSMDLNEVKQAKFFFQ